MKFGDIVYGSHDDKKLNPKMVVAIRTDCPDHDDPPCLILCLPDRENPPELSGWCYTLDGSWVLADE